MEQTSIYVDWPMVMKIKHEMTRTLWVHLMANMDRDQMATVDMRSLVSTKDRSALCKSMKELEGLKLIRQRGQGWLIVWVNPKAVRPYWRKGPLLTRAIKDFETGVPRLNGTDNLLLVPEEDSDGRL